MLTKEIEYLNNIGPDVIEYAEFMKDNFGIVVPYSNLVICTILMK